MLPVRVSLLSFACAACGFDHGVPSIGANGSGSDGGLDMDGSLVDASPDAPPDGRACWGTMVSVCFTTPPTNDRTISTATTLDTSNAATCTQLQAQAGGPELCIIAAQSIHINAALTVGGTRPLVLVATQTIDVGATGLVDLASYRVSTGNGQVEVVGAGEAAADQCGTPTAGAGDNAGPVVSGGGGGAGGSFGGTGGGGADGNNNNGGDGGNGAAAATLMGSIGSNGSTGGGGGGAGGGAGIVDLVRATTIAGQVSPPAT